MTARLYLMIVGLCTCAMVSQAQDIQSRLTGNTTGEGFSVVDKTNNTLFTVRGNGNTGIGTSNPAFKLTLNSDAGILATGTYNSGTTLPSIVDGPIMIWYARKGAFRAGYARFGNWDDSNIGDFSFASGEGTKASGMYAAAFGDRSIASGTWSFAAGNGAEASGGGASAFGYAYATGNYSMAAGQLARADGDKSFAFGFDVKASGEESCAIGRKLFASGDNSVAIGSFVSTNGRTGSMYLGDASATSIGTRQAYGNNHFYAVFHTGFSLFTDKSAGNTYCVVLQNHSTSWSSCSDSSKKENHQPADGESVLRKFSHLRLGSWNFIGHDPFTERHYGPMAQEWYAAFGHDGIGTIGTDTLLASADVDGVLCIAVKALEKRTSANVSSVAELQKELATLREQLRSKDLEIAGLRTRLSAQENEMQEIRRGNEHRYTELERLVRNLQQDQQNAARHVQLLNQEAEQ